MIFDIFIVAVVGLGALFILVNLGIEIWHLFRKKGLTDSDMETVWSEAGLRYNIQQCLQQQFTSNSAWLVFLDQCLAEARGRQVGVWLVYREKHVQLQIRHWWTAWCLMWGVVGCRVAHKNIAAEIMSVERQLSSDPVSLDSSKPHGN